eukprot:Phypoly_transcript_08351.p1 GENE.Phypoly_transcript_08351~~Phypoly_transcript_08351.p1  ORF type:complete len:337 (+),score=45.76 Phypoly_transcript_08351:83-1093(+)
MARPLTRAREQEINRFIDSMKVPAGDVSNARQAINDIATKIQAMGLNVDRPFVAGSFKKGTAVKEEWDVDLVIFFHCKFTEYENEQFRRDRLSSIAENLRKSLKCKIERVSGFCIVLQHKGVSFDVLTAYDATKSEKDQVREQRVNMRELVKNKADKLKYSTSFTESSCEFVAKRRDKSHERLTRAIKLAKVWNKTHFKEDKSHKTFLRSYAMELLLAKIYDLNENKSAPELFLSMLQTIDLAVQKRPLRHLSTITFNDYFPQKQAPNPSRPLRIFDPCFPESDVVGDFEDWETLAKTTRSTLHQIQSDTPVFLIFSSFFFQFIFFVFGIRALSIF